MKQLITRKDGIVYEREVKEPNGYDTKLNIRISKKNYDELKNIAKEKGITYSEMLRNVMEEFIANCKK